MSLDIAKLHEYHIGPRPLCAGCGETVEAGTVWIDSAPRGLFDAFDPMLRSDDLVYHYECKPEPAVSPDSTEPPERR